MKTVHIQRCRKAKKFTFCMMNPEKKSFNELTRADGEHEKVFR